MAEACESEMRDEPEGQAQSESNERPPPRVVLFVKAGAVERDEGVPGCCPFSQRLFMILWLKGLVFNVTTYSKDLRKNQPPEFENLAPGANPPFLLFNDEVLTDVSKCEDYIDAELYPPKYPKLACKYSTSNTAGNDIFAAFSALVKCKSPEGSTIHNKLQSKLITALRKFNNYLETPLDDEIDADAEGEIKSTRKFIDGDTMTLADCNILPKLNILQVAGREIGFSIPDEFEAIHRYLANAGECPEFKETCPQEAEIIFTYFNKKPLKKH